MPPHNFNQDCIRKERNHAYGPMIIERITPYKYNSDFRKVYLQLSRPETSKHVISAWKRDLLGSSSARSTIKYDSIKPTTMCMLKGVPLSTDDINIEKDIERVSLQEWKTYNTMLLTFRKEHIYILYIYVLYMYVCSD